MKSSAQISFNSKRFIKAMHNPGAYTLISAQESGIIVHAYAFMHSACASFVPYAQNNQFSVHNIQINATQ